MNSAELFKLIQSGIAGGIYLFEGQEEYLKEKALREIRESILVPGFEMLNENVFENGSFQEIAESAETMPFMCDKRIVIGKDPVFLTGTVSESELEQIKQWIKRPSASSVVVLYLRGEAKKDKSAYKALDKAGKVVHFELLSESELSSWVVKRLKELGHTAKNPAIEELIDYTGRRMQKLDTELVKLSDIAGTRKEITLEDVRNNVNPDSEVKVFAMLDALTAGKGAEAYDILNRLIDAGEPLFIIYSMVVRQLRLFAHVASLKESGLRAEDIAQRMGEKSPYGVKNVYRQLNGLSKAKLTSCYKKAVEGDFRIKSGQAGAREVLDEMMYLLYSIKA